MMLAAQDSKPESPQTDDSKPTPAQALAIHDISRLLDQPDTSTIALVAFLLGSATAVGASSIYRRYFRRLPSAEYITPNILRRKPWVTGVVTSVGDGDNFRLYHTPGFGWRGLLKFRHIPKRSRGVPTAATPPDETSMIADL
jgi:hypothetical protein